GLLGIYDKLNFLWLVFASIGAAGLLYREAFVELWHHRPRATSVVIIVFALVFAATTHYAVSLDRDLPPTTPVHGADTLFTRLEKRSEAFANTINGQAAFAFVTGEQLPWHTFGAWFLSGGVLGLLALCASRSARRATITRPF